MAHAAGDRSRAVRPLRPGAVGARPDRHQPRIFERPSTVDEVFGFITELADRPTARVVGPGPEHLAILERLCRDAGAAGKLVADAQHAAVAIEHGCTLVSTDADFGRFADLRWRHPLRRPATVHESS